LSGEIAEWLRALMRGSAFTLRGLVVELAERGIKAQSRAVWVFAHRGAELKKLWGLGADASRRRAQTNAVEGSASEH
jgi:putative transposase